MISRTLVCAILSLWFYCTLVKAWDDEFHSVYPSPEEDGILNMEQLAHKYGYPIERHAVRTEDGYILTMYRIPHGLKCKPGEKVKTPVLLLHGLLSSSFDFLILGPKKALAYILADECYDVWLGNNRGNSESKGHVSLKPSQKEFWTFSWHEMGKYDVPAFIDHILNTTGQPSIHYIGHSQGTTQFLVFGTLYPEYHHKIRSMQALSPVAFMGNLASPVIKMLTMPNINLEVIAEMIGVTEMFPNKSILNLLGSKICKNDYPDLQRLCCNVIFLLCGFDEPQLNKTILPAILGHTPAGAGVKSMLHYAQGIKSGKFRQYDYGSQKNLKIYGSKTPPEYDVSKINIPVAIYYGANDFLAAVKDVRKLKRLLPNVIEEYLVPYSKFNHLDFILATDVKHLIYYEVLKVLKKY